MIGPRPSQERLHDALREARDDAAPFALAAAGTLVALSLTGRASHWELLGHDLWWLWLIAAAPYVALAAMLIVGLGHLVEHDRRREIVLALLAVIWICNLLGILLLVASLLSSSGGQMTGRQLLFSGGAVLIANAIAFGLAFWELDCGGPVARALATSRRAPDFQFPQDENPALARADWAPRLWDYFYVSLTNSTAFSPTDAMPLTRPAKALMAAESILGGLTILLVAARAVNILG